MANVPKVKLSNGIEVPQIGFGLWKVNDTANVVYEAIKLGYRLFDGAFDYGNEKEAGEGVKRAIDEGIVKREDLTIVSKLWNTFHEKERVEPIVRQQLEWWGIEYFDIFYMHFPVALEYVDPKDSYPSGWHNLEKKIVQSKATIQETWQALEHLVDIGLTKSIAVSNFQGALLMDLLRYARIRPVILQVEIHPYNAQPAIIAYAKAEGIAVTAYSSLGPASFIELKWDKAFNAVPLFVHPTTTAIAANHKKTPAQVVFRWATQQGLLIIPKSTNPDIMKENLESATFDLTEDESKQISALNVGLRFNNPPDYLNGLLPIFA